VFELTRSWPQLLTVDNTLTIFSSCLNGILPSSGIRSVECPRRLCLERGVHDKVADVIVMSWSQKVTAGNVARVFAWRYFVTLKNVDMIVSCYGCVTLNQRSAWEAFKMWVSVYIGDNVDRRKSNANAKIHTYFSFQTCPGCPATVNAFYGLVVESALSVRTYLHRPRATPLRKCRRMTRSKIAGILPKEAVEVRTARSMAKLWTFQPRLS
jgi:hypothetical protein